MLGLLTLPLVPNVADNLASGQVHMVIEPNTKQPQFRMKVKTHDAVTAGSWYAIGWKTKRPVSAALSAGTPWMVGQATETLTAAGWTEFIVAGYVYQCASSGSIADGADVEVLTGGVTVVIDAGADHPLVSANGLGHAVAAASGNLVDVWLYGRMFPTVASS